MIVKAYNTAVRASGVQSEVLVGAFESECISRGVDIGVSLQRIVVDGFIPLEDILFDDYQIAYFDTTAIADLDAQKFRAKYGGGS